MLQTNKDFFDEDFSNISDAFKHKTQVRLMMDQNRLPRQKKPT